MTVEKKSVRLGEIESQLKEIAEENALIHDARRYIPSGGQRTGAFPLETSPTGSTRSADIRMSPIKFGDVVLRGLYHAAQSRQSLRIDTKDLGGDLEADLPPILGPTLGRLTEPTRVASLLPAVGMVGPVIQYPRITGQTGAATVVAPGGLKPSVGFTTDLVTATATKIAGITSVNDEVLADFDGFYRLVSSELATSVILAENLQLLNGDGTGGSIPGLLHSAAITRTAATGETVLDTIEQGLTDVRVGAAYAQPDGIVMNPNDWSRLRRAKDVNGRYLLTDAPSADVVPTLFGCPVITTTTIAEGTALVGAFAIAAAVHVRLGLTVEANNRSDTDWTRNTTTFRAEERIALAVYRPAALAVVTLGA